MIWSPQSAWHDLCPMLSVTLGCSGPGEVGPWLGAQAALAEDPTLSPVTRVAAHNHSQLHFCGIGCQLLTYPDTRHALVLTPLAQDKTTTTSFFEPNLKQFCFTDLLNLKHVSPHKRAQNRHGCEHNTHTH